MQYKVYYFLLYLLILSFSHSPLFSQAGEETKKGEGSGAIKTRFITTMNRGDLKDFSILVSYANYEYKRQINNWLRFGIQGNALVNYGTNGIGPDAITGSGPIYEGNLWNDRLMSGSAELHLPQIYAQLSFGSSEVTIGQFLQDTPLINPEPWPFPIALKGLWYKYRGGNGVNFQLGSIFQISPRMDNRFYDIDESLALTGAGVDTNGNPAQYRGNVESDVILIANANFSLGPNAGVDIWNYYVDNVTNTLLIEPQMSFGDGTWKANMMYIWQTRINNGGNDLIDLAYTFDSNASYFGLRLQKDWTNSSLLQLNFSRIADSGRLLLPREWGLEPFYTFQRRTRIEGNSDVTAIMVKWQQTWEKEKGKTRFFTSLGQHWMPGAFDAPRNKRQLPGHLHVAASLLYQPKWGLKNFSAEIYTAYRFLTDDIGTDLSALINRADFYHLDLIIGYKF
jgi:hypothetical protein